MMRDIEILRDLANQYAECANSDCNLQNVMLHRMVNDLKQPTPIVLMDEIPWEEFEYEEELTLLCEKEEYRKAEQYFRQMLYRWRHFRGNMVLPPYYGVRKIIHHTGIGISAKADECREGFGTARVYHDQLQEEEDLEKIHPDVITYDEKESKTQWIEIAEAIGDVLPVKLTGQPTGYEIGCRTWDEIVLYKGLDTLFFDLVDRPEFMHKIVRKMTDIFLDTVRQYEEQNLLDGDAYYLHSTAYRTNDLKPDQRKVRAKDVWGRGLAQIFASVSPKLHDEFDIQYMVEAMKPFGLVYYGCCEPLHEKIEILEKIPNLRKISITPWADVDVATEKMGSRYVLSAKPNPAYVASSPLDRDGARAELRKIVSAAKRNSCSCELVLKDISTVSKRVGNLPEWEKIALEEAQRYWD